MNLQEANRIREKMRDLQLQHDKLAERVAALEAYIQANTILRGRRKDESRKAIL